MRLDTVRSSRVRGALGAGLLAALVAALTGCSGGGSDNGGNPQASGPVVTISPGPQPASLCDLLTPADFDTLAGVKATAPKADKASATQAYCSYGKDIEVDVFVEGSADEAHATYLTVVKDGPITAVQSNLLGGVDESVYGNLPKSVGFSLRRNKLVIAIELPTSAGAADGHIKMIKLAGQALQRAGSLGT